VFYKALGFAVWKGAKWYAGRKLPSRNLMLGGAAALGAATLAAAGAARGAGSD
jgi:hypothetical protein